MTSYKNKIKIAIRESEGEATEKKKSKLPMSGPEDLNSTQFQPADTEQYTMIGDLLIDGNIYNRAAIVQRLWGTNNASNRSEFGKRLGQETHDGSKHQFSTKEIAGIASILQNPGAMGGTISDDPEKHDDDNYIQNYGKKR